MPKNRRQKQRRFLSKKKIETIDNGLPSSRAKQIKPGSTSRPPASKLAADGRKDPYPAPAARRARLAAARGVEVPWDKPGLRALAVPS
jgi:hypothetical protein